MIVANEVSKMFVDLNSDYGIDFDDLGHSCYCSMFILIVYVLVFVFICLLVCHTIFLFIYVYL